MGVFSKEGVVVTLLVLTLSRDSGDLLIISWFHDFHCSAVIHGLGALA